MGVRRPRAVQLPRDGALSRAAGERRVDYGHHSAVYGRKERGGLLRPRHRSEAGGAGGGGAAAVGGVRGGAEAGGGRGLRRVAAEDVPADPGQDGDAAERADFGEGDEPPDGGTQRDGHQAGPDGERNERSGPGGRGDREEVREAVAQPAGGAHRAERGAAEGAGAREDALAEAAEGHSRSGRGTAEESKSCFAAESETDEADGAEGRGRSVQQGELGEALVCGEEDEWNAQIAIRGVFVLLLGRCLLEEARWESGEEREAISQGGVGTVLFSRFFEEGEWVWYK